MSASLKSVGAITLFVEDPRRSKSFYERVFQLSPIYEDENAVAFLLGRGHTLRDRSQPAVGLPRAAFSLSPFTPGQSQPLPLPAR